MTRAVALVLAAALAVVPAALASERHPTQAELEGEVMCPECHTTLDQSNSPIARGIKAFVAQRIRAGDTKSQIESKLVAQFGTSILAAPPKHGFSLLAWLLPIVGLLTGAVVVGAAAWRWSRSRAPQPALALAGSGLDPELERRLDDELRRFDE